MKLYVTSINYTDIECLNVLFFFFKQKTAYEMRISDWSSDGALPILARQRSGDRRRVAVAVAAVRRARHRRPARGPGAGMAGPAGGDAAADRYAVFRHGRFGRARAWPGLAARARRAGRRGRRDRTPKTQRRRVGNEGVSTSEIPGATV